MEPFTNALEALAQIMRAGVATHPDNESGATSSIIAPAPNNTCAFCAKAINVRSTVLSLTRLLAPAGSSD